MTTFFNSETSAQPNSRAKDNIENTNQPNLTIGELIDRYQLHNSSRGLTKDTIAVHRYAFQHLVTFLGGEQASSIQITSIATIDEFCQYLRGKELAQESINTYIRSLKALLNWAKRRSYIPHLPQFDQQSRARKHQPIKPILSPKEIGMLLEAAQEEDTLLLQLRAKALILVLYDTGLRASEICNAKWKDIVCHNIDGENTNVLRIIGAKTGKPREVVLSRECWKAVTEYREELKQPHGRGNKFNNTEPIWIFIGAKNLENPEPMTVNGLRACFKRLGDKCGIHSNPHKFRRTFATAWLENSEGQQVEVLMAIGGWEDFRTIKNHYVHFRTPLLIRAARRNSPLSNSSTHYK